MKSLRMHPPSFRPSVKGLMIAVVLTPIVYFSARWASLIWGTTWKVATPNGVEVDLSSLELTDAMIASYSPWPGPIAGLVTTTVLGVSWWGLERMRRSLKARPRIAEEGRTKP